VQAPREPDLLERKGLSAQERREQARDFHRRYRKEIRARSRPR
jgi:hypothetical protein